MLAEELGTLGLRTVAARLGTSDRMLIYYFGTKEQLVIEMLDKVEARMAPILAANSEGPTMSAGAFLGSVLDLSADPQVAPFFRLWTEVIARGARGEAPYDAVARRVVHSWIAWIGSRLVPSPGAGGEDGRPAALLAIVEGLGLLELASPGSTREAGRALVRMLDGEPGAP